MCIQKYFCIQKYSKWNKKIYYDYFCIQNCKIHSLAFQSKFLRDVIKGQILNTKMIHFFVIFEKMAF